MWKTLSFLQKNFVWTIPFMMIGGIVTGYLFDVSFLKLSIMPLTFLMVYPMMVNLQLEKVFSLDDIKCQIVTQIINFGIIPFIAYATGVYFFSDRPMIMLGLLLAALLPTSGMTISWTGFAGGNVSAAVKMTVTGLILGSVATPLYAKFLMGSVVDIPLSDIFIQIVLIVFAPMIFGYLTRKGLVKKYGQKKYMKDFKEKFPALSSLGVLGIVFVAMALKAKGIVNNPSVLLYYLIPLVFLYSVNFFISTLVGKLFFDRGEAVALLYGTVMRNLSIALAIAMTVFGEKGAEIAVIISMAYIIQVQSAAWYVRFTDRIFGRAEALKPAIS